MRIRTGFGWIEIDGRRFDHDVVVTPSGQVLPRPKHISAPKREKYGHTPLSREEVTEILKRVGDVEVLVIGTGQDGLLPVEREALDELRKRGVEVICAKTPEAIEEFLRLVKSRRVAAVFHVTC